VAEVELWVEVLTVVGLTVVALTVELAVALIVDCVVDVTVLEVAVDDTVEVLLVRVAVTELRVVVVVSWSESASHSAHPPHRFAQGKKKHFRVQGNGTLVHTK